MARLLIRSFVFLLLFRLVATAAVKPEWAFSVRVAVEKQTADYYERTLNKPIKVIVREQMATVNANFNRSPNFNGIYNFWVDTVYVFSGPVGDEIYRPHPDYNYGLVINGFSNGSPGGGWWGNQQTIYHSWASNSVTNGPFGPAATDALTFDFALARGGVALYGMRVEGSKNPVNNQSFEPVNSLMTSPYGNIVWDEYTTNLLNSTADGPITGQSWIITPFPRSISIRAVNKQGVAVDNVKLSIYPGDWFSYAVSPSAMLEGVTDVKGNYTFASNPFQPGSTGYPWNMRYSNFLIKAVFDGKTSYRWLPLYEVQNAYFRDGANADFVVEINIPVDSPTFRTKALTKTTVCAGTMIMVECLTTGNIGSYNNFLLQAAPWPDSSANAFFDLPPGGTVHNLVLSTLPLTIPEGIYWIRVKVVNPRTISYGSVSPTPLTIRSVPTASLTGTQTIYQGESADLIVTLTGEAPWTVTYRDKTETSPGNEYTVGATSSPLRLSVKPSETTAYFLTVVSNSCGSYTPSSARVIVTVLSPLGVSEPADALQVYPIPAASLLTVRIQGLSASQSAQLEVVNTAGQAVWQGQTQQEVTEVSLGQQPPGVYVLRVRVGQQLMTRRILKQ